MATKIRLQRHGRKGYAFYPIVIADSRCYPYRYSTQHLVARRRAYDEAPPRWR